MVLKLQISQVTDIEDREVQEPMADQVATNEREVSLCVFVECCSLLTNVENFWFLW